MQSDRIPIIATVGDERHSQGDIEVIYFSFSGRLKQACKKLMIFWLFSGLSVLLPVVHFVSVPVLFFLGIFFAYRSFKSEGKVTRGLIKCPHCKSEVPIKPGELHWPLSEICQNCARVVRIANSFNFELS